MNGVRCVGSGEKQRAGKTERPTNRTHYRSAPQLEAPTDETGRQATSVTELEEAGGKKGRDARNGGREGGWQGVWCGWVGVGVDVDVDAVAC